MDKDHLAELFSVFGPIEVRRMFGAAGLFADGVMFGLVSGGVIYLKADADTAPRFAGEGCEPFSYATKTGRRTVTSHWRMPDRLYDDPDELAEWARLAVGTAVAAGTKKRR